MKSKKRTTVGDPWPASWDVSFTWAHGKTILESRKHMFQLEGSPQWYVFDRHVLNTRNDAEWLDCFTVKPYGAFSACRPNLVTKVKQVDNRGTG